MERFCTKRVNKNSNECLQCGGKLCAEHSKQYANVCSVCAEAMVSGNTVGMEQDGALLARSDAVCAAQQSHRPSSRAAASSSGAERFALQKHIYGVQSPPKDWVHRARTLLDDAGLGMEFLGYAMQHVEYVDGRTVQSDTTNAYTQTARSSSSSSNAAETNTGLTPDRYGIVSSTARARAEGRPEPPIPESWPCWGDAGRNNSGS